MAVNAGFQNKRSTVVRTYKRTHKKSHKDTTKEACSESTMRLITTWSTSGTIWRFFARSPLVIHIAMYCTEKGGLFVEFTAFLSESEQKVFQCVVFGTVQRWILTEVGLKVVTEGGYWECRL